MLKKICVILILCFILPVFCFGAARYIPSEKVEISEEKKAEILAQEPKELSVLSEDIKKTIPQKDLLELYCLETKARSKEFFAALFALESILTPVSNDLKSIGIKTEIPDIHAYTSEAYNKLEAICSASNLDEAQIAGRDFRIFGEKVRAELMDLKYNLARRLKAKGEELKKEMEEKVRKEVEQWVQGEKAKIEEELNNLANQLAEEAKNNLIQEMQQMQFTDEATAQAYAQSRVEQIKAEITARINQLAEEKRKKLEEEANKKAEELLGGDVETFKNIAQRMENIEREIENLMAQKSKEYQQYQAQAAQKRRELILMLIDKKVEEGMQKLKEKNEMIKKKGLPVPDLDTYISWLEKDKEELIKKIDQAITENRFDSINLIVYEMQERWKKRVQAINRDYLERYSPKVVCGDTLWIIKSQTIEEKVKDGIQRIDLALNRDISWAKGKCQSLNLPSDDPACQRVEKLEKELSEAKTKAENFLSQIKTVKEKCSKVTDATKIEEIMDDLISFRNKGKAYQKEIEALKARWEKDIKEIYDIIMKDPKKYKL
ncbi:hypothetical protein J7K44_02315 [bacterium]|nr:hypothetical protein [bacterium]